LEEGEDIEEEDVSEECASCPLEEEEDIEEEDVLEKWASCPAAVWCGA